MPGQQDSKVYINGRLASVDITLNNKLKSQPKVDIYINQEDEEVEGDEDCDEFVSPEKRVPALL